MLSYFLAFVSTIFMVISVYDIVDIYLITEIRFMYLRLESIEMIWS